MAAWFTVVAPLLPELIRAARPMFTRSREPSQIPQQIRELQDAVDHNDQAIKTLAGEMEQTLSALKQASAQLEATLADFAASRSNTSGGCTWCNGWPVWRRPRRCWDSRWRSMR